MKSIVAYDPGESTGWATISREGRMDGGTLPRDHVAVATHLTMAEPDIVIIESFKLYPGKAASLAWNSFYPCEVIGVLKYICDLRDIPYFEQAPSVKKYCGGLSTGWPDIQDLLRLRGEKTTEHVKDAYMHLAYFLRNKKAEAGLL